MTLNDQELNARCLMVRQLAEQLPILMRDGKIADLDRVIGLIIHQATFAGYRLNDLRWPRPALAPQELMGG